MIEILRLSLPITVWLTAFSAGSALQGLSCSRHWRADLDARPVLIAPGAVAIVLQLIALMAVLYAQSPARFGQTTGIELAATALFAAVWTIMPVLAASICP